MSKKARRRKTAGSRMEWPSMLEAEWPSPYRLSRKKRGAEADPSHGIHLWIKSLFEELLVGGKTHLNLNTVNMTTDNKKNTEIRAIRMVKADQGQGGDCRRS